MFTVCNLLGILNATKSALHESIGIRWSVRLETSNAVQSLPSWPIFWRNSADNLDMVSPVSIMSSTNCQLMDDMGGMERMTYFNLI